MNIILWIIFGAISGWVASMLMKNDANQGTLTDIVLGVIGAVIGGFIMEMFGQPGVTGFNLYSFIVAIIGASVVIGVGRALRGGRVI